MKNGITIISFFNSGNQNTELTNRETENSDQNMENRIQLNSNSAKNSLRIARGYRLKVSTHNMIKSLSQLTGMDSDTLITEAFLLLNKKILEENESIFKSNKEAQP